MIVSLKNVVGGDEVLKCGERNGERVRYDGSFGALSECKVIIVASGDESPAKVVLIGKADRDFITEDPCGDVRTGLFWFTLSYRGVSCVEETPANVSS